MPASSRYLPGWALALLAVLGVVFVIVGIVYFLEPAKSLPSFFPGHLAGSAHHHTKHGIAAIVVGLVCFAGAWLGSGSGRTAAA